MNSTRLNGFPIDYEVRGAGEPLLLIGTGPFADSFQPLLTEPALTDAFQLIRYRQRGQTAGYHGPIPVTFADHAADAAALLRHLGIPRAHVAGHSTGAVIALQLAADRPELVQSLVLLEPPLMAVPSAGSFLERIGPALEAFARGDGERAMLLFLAVVASLDEAECRRVVEERIPGGMAQAVAGADTFFGSYLPALQQWTFGALDAAGIEQPVLLVIGSETDRLFAEGGELLEAWFPQLEHCRIHGAGHLLHVQQPGPVARGIAGFLERVGQDRRPVAAVAPAASTG